MADTFTTDGVGLILMGIGGDNNTWGTNLNNSALQPIADALSNALTTAASAGALGPGNTLDLSGSPPPAASSQARYNALFFTGAITANQTVIVPNLRKWWWIFNQTTGAFTVTLQLPGALSPTVIPQRISGGGGAGDGWLVYCDGSGVLILSAVGVHGSLAADCRDAFPAYTFLNEQNSGWYRNGTQDIRLAINGSDVLQVTGTGAASPSVVNLLSPQTLQVAGANAGFFTTGDVKLTFKTVADAGWLMMDDNTIGDASSNATHASAANSALFQLLYNNLSDADAPILTSGGAATTRGAQGSAATAFANHCRLTLSLTLGRALAAAGSGSGLTARALGHAVGAETYALQVNDLPPHTHTYSGTTGTESATHTHSVASGAATAGNLGIGGVNPTYGAGQATGTESATHTHTYSGSTANGGFANNAIGLMQPTTFLNVMIKL